ncbi:hypothetical protein AZE42_02328 [Rhizopogon vesiculosus]|uniref:Uncharacterized protein n=1 Tax=Rhizopogon vesiculosus TaxID=180088 RepID=A0A1J8PKR0_9AGAM|nr:hypothetical protein AZE42_02328 [Rhizopogon vesiculosus]
MAGSIMPLTLGRRQSNLSYLKYRTPILQTSP